jgi:hypothetical protein
MKTAPNPDAVPSQSEIEGIVAGAAVQILNDQKAILDAVQGAEIAAKLWASDSPRRLDHFRASRPSELFGSIRRYSETSRTVITCGRDGAMPGLFERFIRVPKQSLLLNAIVSDALRLASPGRSNARL